MASITDDIALDRLEPDQAELQMQHDLVLFQRAGGSSWVVLMVSPVSTRVVSELVLAEYLLLPWTPPQQLPLFAVHYRRLRSCLPLRLTEPRLSLSRKIELHRHRALVY